MRKLTITLYISLLTLLTFGIFGPEAYADYDVECVAEGVATYMDGILSEVEQDKGSFSKLKFLSPAFNMTEAQFPDLVNAIAEYSSYWDNLDGLAGNAYNTSWSPGGGGPGTIMDWVENAYKIPAFKKNLVLTEIGWHDYANDAAADRSAARTKLADQIGKLKGDGRIIGATLFNAFGTGNSEWARYIVEDGEYGQLCGGSCDKIGSNTASSLGSEDYFDQLKNKGMRYNVGIVFSDDDGAREGAKTAINAALDRSITTVIRIGVGADSGGFYDSTLTNPAQPYVDFLKKLNSEINGIAYVIAGPNEPNAEMWASPNCGESDSTTGQNVKIKGFVFTSRPTTMPGKAAVRTNAPVKNLKLVAYEGTSATKTGKFAGQVPRGQGKETLTRADGYYEIELRKGSGLGGYNYLVLYSNDQVVDSYKVTTKKSFNGFDITVDSDTDGTNSLSTPEMLDLVDRANPLACERPTNAEKNANNLISNAITLGRNLVARVKLVFGDDPRYQGTDANTVPSEEQPQEPSGQGGWYQKKLPTVQLEGRSNITGIAADWAATIQEGYCLANGCVGGKVEYAKNDQLPSCEEFKAANSPTTDTADGSYCNQQTCGGYWNNLAGPATSNDERKIKYLEFLADINAHPVNNVYICQNAGTKLKFTDFQSPWYAESEIVEITGKDPTCQPGSADCYTLNVKYFPYSRLYGGNRSAQETKAETIPINDAYGSERRTIPFSDEASSAGDMKKLSKGYPDDTTKAFAFEGLTTYPRENTSLPATDTFTYKIAEKKQSKVKSLPIDVITDPDFPDPEDAPEDPNKPVKKTVPKKYSEIKVGGGYYRIGSTLRPNCICPPSDPDCKERQNDFGENPDDLKWGWPAGYKFRPGAVINNEEIAQPNSFFGAAFTDIVGQLQGLFADFARPWGEGFISILNAEKLEGTSEGKCTKPRWRQVREDELAACVRGTGDCRCKDGTTTCKKIAENLEKPDSPAVSYTCNGRIQGLPPLEKSISFGVPAPVSQITTANINFKLALVGDPLEEGVVLKVDSLAQADARSTHEANPKEAFGNDKTLGPSAFAQNNELIRAVGDPQFSETRLERTRFKPPASVDCKKVYQIVTATSGQCTIKDGEVFGTTVPDTLKTILEKAGERFNVPPSLILAIMASEGAFNPASPYDWSDDVVKQEICSGVDMPTQSGDECDPESGVAQGPLSWLPAYWGNFKNAINDEPGLENRIPSVCNLLDQVYATAQKLGSEKQGTTKYEPRTPLLQCIPKRGYFSTGDTPCFGILLNRGTTAATTCADWTLRDVATAQRQYAGYCIDTKGSGAAPNQNVCDTRTRETYNTCASNFAGCSSYTNNIYKVYEGFKE